YGPEANGKSIPAIGIKSSNTSQSTPARPPLSLTPDHFPGIHGDQQNVAETVQSVERIEKIPFKSKGPASDGNPGADPDATHMGHARDHQVLYCGPRICVRQSD